MDYTNKAEVENYAKRVADEVALFFLHNKTDVELDHKRATQQIEEIHRRRITHCVEVAEEFFRDSLGAATELRPKRTIQVELHNLWKLALNSYANFSFTVLPEQFQDLLSQNPVDREQFNRDQIATFVKFGLPVLREQKAPGDYIYRLAIKAIQLVDDDAVSAAIARRRPIPVNSFELYYGIFGLLIQADNYLAEGKEVEAYSCLNDANQGLGIAAGSRQVTNRFVKSAKSRNGINNNKKSREIEEWAKLWVLELLRPIES